MLGFTLCLREPKRERRPQGNALRNLLAVVQASVTSPRLLTVMLLWGLLLSTGITAIWGYFLYYGAEGVPLAAYGALTAAFQLASSLGANRAASIEGRLGSVRTLLLPLATPLVLVPFAFVHSRWIVPLAWGQAFLWGLSTPLLLGRINRLTGSEVRATTLSIGAMVGRVLYIGMGLAFGAIATRASLAVAFGALALWFAAAGLALTLRLLRQERREEQAEAVAVDGPAQ